MKEKINQKGFIPIPIIIAITFFLIIIGGGVVLYETNQIHPFNNTVDSSFDFTSDVIYKLIWQSKFEKEMLEQEVKLSNIKREQAETKTREETARRKEEEIARAEAEEKAQQETVKRSQAEAKAKQEEFEKKLKEQQLSEKEAEEKRMNADNDGDGLTYRRELELGTSDWDTDSDGDGIKDSEDLHPAGGGGYQAQYFQWEYDGTIWEHKLSIPDDWYEYYKNKPRKDQGTEYLTYDDRYIEEIAQYLKNNAERMGYHLTSFIVSFIQGLPYVEDYYTGFDDRPKYPIETIVDRNGDCEDTSYLFASIVRATGIGVALVEFYNHMGVGINTVHEESGYYYPIDNDWYYYYETTAEGWSVGELPSDYVNVKAKVTRSWENEGQYVYPSYKKPCDPAKDFSGYYYSNGNFYRDSGCNSLITCLPYEEFYYNSNTERLYWDSSCVQLVVKGCSKSTNYLGYFTNGVEYYHDSACNNKARVCRLSSYSYDKYWDGYDFYWDSNCTQKVVSWCPKSIYYPGYFYNTIDTEIYLDYRCTQPADLY